MSRKSGSMRASIAALIFSTISAGGISCLPSMCPHFLGRRLVLDVDAGDPCPLVLLDGADHVDRVPVAGVGVGEYRDRQSVDDPAGVVDHLRHRQQPDVGPAKPGSRGAEACHVGRLKAGLLHQTGAEGVVAAGAENWLGACQQLAEPAPWIGIATQEWSRARASST